MHWFCRLIQGVGQGEGVSFMVFCVILSVVSSGMRFCGVWWFSFAVGIGGSPCVFWIFIISIHYALCMVLCVGFADRSKMWGRVKVWHSWGVVLSSRSFRLVWGPVGFRGDSCLSWEVVDPQLCFWSLSFQSIVQCVWSVVLVLQIDELRSSY